MRARSTTTIWRGAKLLYIGLLVDHKRPELAETFFNSVVTRVLRRTYVHNDFAFVRAAVSTEYIESDPPIYRSYYPAERRPPHLRSSTSSPTSAGSGRSPTSSVTSSSSARPCWSTSAASWPPREPNHQVQVLGSAFYRNKAAYVIGKIVNGNEETPFARRRCSTTRTAGSCSTPCCSTPTSISVLFSLSRAYFMVDMDVPSGYVQFLQTLMPTKPRSELYTVGRAREAGQDPLLSATCSTTCTTRRTSSSRLPARAAS